MIDYKLIALTLAVEAGIVFGGGYLISIGIKKGLIQRRMERRGEIIEGSDAVRAGVFLVFIGVFCWVAAAIGAWALWKGRVHW